MNPTDFDFKRVAQGYRERPFLHRQVLERFHRDMTFRPFSNGLDVGCGAGLSSKALKLICRHVTGSDISGEMIAVAREVCADEEGCDFIVCPAEELPDFEKKFDIVTAAGAVQWIRRAPFLYRLRDIMEERGALLIYDFCITDQMKDCPDYTSWWHDMYLKEFPRPSRDESVWTGADVAGYGFLMRDQIRYEMEYEFDLDSFVRFMMIQSNVNARIEGEGRRACEVRKWLQQSARPLFQGGKRTVIFGGYSWYMERRTEM